MTDRPGALIIIGGGEDKTGDREILKAVAERARGGRLVIATVASHEPDGYFEAYKEAFEPLGISDLVELYVNSRRAALKPEVCEVFAGASGVFFTGGDQLRIASQIGDTPIEHAIKDLYANGGVVAGTSAGASAMSETMLVAGPGRETYRIGELHMAPGLGLLPDVIIDQHFAERGRHGRLVGAVAHNPRILGLGVDEDTAMVVEGDRFTVIGAGGVHVFDGEACSQSNIAEADSSRALSIFDVRMHVLSTGDAFDLRRRRPQARDPD